MLIRQIDAITGVTADIDPVYSPVWSDFPISTKTETCSGTETVYKTLQRCLNPLGTDVALEKCSNLEKPSFIYKSPEGEFASSQSIEGGLKYFRCEEGSTVKVGSRVSCNLPTYFAQADLSCGLDLFSGQYAVITNPVPNACDGTQIVQRPLVSSSCVGLHNGPVADSFCNQTTPQEFKSPAGETNNAVSISGGVSYYNCEEGSSLKVADTRVVCDGTHTAYNLTCKQTVISCTGSNGSGSQTFNQGSGLYESCVVSSCNSGYTLQSGACVQQICSPSSTTPCSENNGSGLKTCSADGLLYLSCVLNNCNSGYYLNGFVCNQQLCTPNSSASCLISNGTGTKLCNGNGSSYGSCSVSSCNTSFHSESNTCMTDIQSCTISNGVATKLWNSGTQSYGTCTLTLCNGGYYQSGNACISQVCTPNATTSCSISNGSGTQTCNSNGSANGSCTVSSCNSGYGINGNICSPTTCSLPWGGSIGNNASVTAYQLSAGLNCNGGNPSQTRTCTWGVLSGSYTYQSANNRNCNCKILYLNKWCAPGVYNMKTRVKSGGSPYDNTCTNGTWAFDNSIQTISGDFYALLSGTCNQAGQ